MGLSFLAPLFLAGLAAVAIPLVVHLRRRTERREVPFPSLRFLRDQPVRTEQRRRLRNLGLLALRIGALALLAAAFARPFLAGDDEALAGTVGPREVVVLLDRSWSMSAPGRWDAGLAAVGRTLDGLGPRDRVSLVLFDDGADAPVRSTADHRRALRAAREAAPGDGGTRFAPALRLAGSLLQASSRPGQEVVLVSDFPPGAWSADDGARLPAGVALRSEPVGEPPAHNVSVLEAGALPAAAGDGSGTRVRARLLLHGEEAVETEAVLVAAGRERSRRRVRLEPGLPTEVHFGPVAVAQGPLRVTVRVAPDDVPADDAYHLVLNGESRISVLVLEEAGGDEPSLYLRRALELSREPPVGVTVSSARSPGAGLLRGHDVVVLNDRPLPGGVSGRALADFVEAGGGLLLAAGPGVEGPGDGPLSLPARTGAVREPRRDGTFRLGSVDRSHPVFEPFREAGSGNLTAARFYRARELTPGDSARVLARFDDGAPALVEGRAGRGRILLWASTLNTFWTDLPVQPVFLPLVNRAVIHLASLRSIPASYRVGDALDPATLGPDGGGGDGPDAGAVTTVRLPDGEELAVEGGPDPTPLILDRAGFHRILTGEGEGPTVAVNAPRDEELTPGLDPEELSAAVTARDSAGAASARSGEAGEGTVAARDRERSQGLWRFLLVGALLLLVAETIVSNRLSRGRAGGRARQGGRA